MRRNVVALIVGFLFASTLVEGAGFFGGGGGSGGVISGTTTCTGCTNNALLKSNGSGIVVSSSVTDDGTTVSTTEQIKASGTLTAGTGPTTLTDSTGKILSAALNTVGVAQGGTGLASGTSGGILGFTGSATIASSAALGAGQVVLGGGAGATPTSSSAFTFSGGTATINNGANAVSPLIVQDNGVSALEVAHTASSLNGVKITPGATGVGPTIAAVGETNVPLILASKGAASILVPFGTFANPAIAFSGNTGLGFVRNGADIIEVVSGLSTPEVAFGNTFGHGLTIPVGNYVQFASTGIASSDVLLSRAAAAVLQMGVNSNTPTTQTIEALNAASGNNNGSNLVLMGGNKAGSGQDGVAILGKGYLVSTLPSGTPVDGSRAWVTDQLTTCAAIGVAPTGGGSVHCPVFFNGSAWVSG